MQKNRKELRDAYKEKPKRGGIYVILNSKNGRYLLSSTLDIDGARNRFGFAVKVDSCVDYLLTKDWKEFGASAFSLEVLEEMTMKPEQTSQEFAEDLKVLLSFWKEKYDPALSY